MKRILCACLTVMILMCAGCGNESGRYRRNEPVQSINTAMGTIISQTIYLNSDSEVNVSKQDAEKELNNYSNREITTDILKTIISLEQNMLSWRLDTSELYAVNEDAGKEEGILLSERLAEILEECIDVSEASEGAFDVTIGEVVRLWDIDSWAGTDDATDYKLPGEDDIREKLKNTGYEKLVLHENMLYLSTDMQLDLGAVGKGIVLDSLREYLSEREEVTGAVISVGGSVLTFGQKADGSPWRVGVVNPLDASKNLGYLELGGQWCVSTSGDYERYVEVDDTRYHHIINPANGYPADSGLRSVTILTKNGLLSDALSTACFILGQEKGSMLVEKYDAEALFVDHEGNISMTKGMENYFNLYQ